MNELNPNHPVTSAMRDQWHKLAAILMHKHGLTHVVITSEDMESMGSEMCVMVQASADGIHLRLITMAEGERLAREQGGRHV